MSKVLIAHSDPATTRELESALRQDLHAVRIANDGLDAIDRALDEKPDAIVLGVDLDGLSGLDAARALRALEPTRRIPILFIAADEGQAAQVGRSGLPFVDSMLAPVSAERWLEHSERLLNYRAPVHEPRPGEPDQHLAAIADPVTGLYARHYMLHRLAYESARSARYHTPLSCAIFGVDEFRGLAQELGRTTADRVMLDVANVFRRAARVTDIIGRAGEDEFLMITPHTDEKGAKNSAARLRQLIAEYDYELPRKRARLDFSVGLAGTAGSSLAENLALLGRAESALRRARERQEKILVG